MVYKVRSKASLELLEGINREEIVIRELSQRLLLEMPLESLKRFVSLKKTDPKSEESRRKLQNIHTPPGEIEELVDLLETRTVLFELEVEDGDTGNKTIWNFDCWDKTGKGQTVHIEALNVVNAMIIFRHKYEDWVHDPPY